jgi:predicted DCC family thiol-disulfide oxidoreductase YuxK
MATISTDERPSAVCTTVYFDGACALCNTEILYYRRQKGSEALRFVDVSAEGGIESNDLTRAEALKRFHIRTPDGRLVSGAAAFVAIWHLLPGWSWAARIATLPGGLVVLEALYRVFLWFRPPLSRLCALLGMPSSNTTG